ncbi:MAG: HPr family phosphocarrier protein [Chlamydiia bacterium]|nr:HPr family phosphocarrier protein [Chlamydiia bacterium]
MISDQGVKTRAKAYFVVRNDRGLHTRPSTELVKCASGFRARIYLHVNGMTVNAKSLLGVLTLAATRGTRVRMEAEGEDAEDAVQNLVSLAERNFNMAY